MRTKPDPSTAAIAFALDLGMECATFLRLWNEGEFDVIRKEWPEAPDAIFIGADPSMPFDDFQPETAPAPTEPFMATIYNTTGWRNKVFAALKRAELYFCLAKSHANTSNGYREQMAEHEAMMIAAIKAIPHPNDPAREFTDAEVDALLRTRIPGGSEAAAWFAPHEGNDKAKANIRYVVRALIAAANSSVQGPTP